jgi:HEAT repeat protein
LFKLCVYTMPIIFLFFLFILTPSLNYSADEEASISRRIALHLLLEDSSEALAIARKSLEKYPESRLIQNFLIKSYVASGNGKAALSAWNSYVKLFPECLDDHDLLEQICWAVIRNGAGQSSLNVRLHSLIGAVLGRDAYSVPIVRSNLRSSNSLLRGIAVRLTCSLGDTELQKEVLNILRNDNSWNVRLEAIKAVGKMQMHEAQDDLEEILSSSTSSAEEKAAAIGSTLELFRTVGEDEILRLSKSDRVGLRTLACELVAYFDLQASFVFIEPLIQDSHPMVRSAAMKVFGFSRTEYPLALVQQALLDKDKSVAVMSAWLLVISEKMKPEDAYAQLLSHELSEVRALAASSLAATGKYGLDYSLRVFEVNEDPFVRANLAMGLIGQRTEVERSCDALLSLLERGEQVMWKVQGSGMFRALQQGKLRHLDGDFNYPEVMNQVCRLEVLNTLAVMNYKLALDGVRRFLHEKNWGITAFAAEVLLQEGDESVFGILRELLSDSDKHVRVQAALALAIWGKDQDVVDVLQEAYPEADRELKATILEAIGFIGGAEAFPFLVDRLGEPFQTLRIIAAASLIQGINK